MPFVNLIIDFHGAKALRSFRDYNEIAFQTGVESLLPFKQYLSEMRLVKDFKKKNLRYGFTDVFVCDCYGYKGVVLELKCISMLGLYNGEMGAWKKEMIDWESLKNLNDELKTEPEDVLMDRNYIYYSKDDKKYKLTTVRNIIEDGLKQTHDYVKIASNGEFKQNKTGIWDERIKIEDGDSFLGGYLIVSLGSGRILTRTINLKKINYRFLKIYSISIY